MYRARFFAILGFIAIAMMSRFLPHLPNMTAINAIALFSVFTLGRLSLSVSIVFAAMFLSDLVFGLHSQMLFVYLSLALTVLISRLRLSLPVSLIISSLIFFTVVNFGVWLLDGFYPQTFAGLGFCYLAALPFLVNQLIGDLLYGAALFGLFALSEKTFPRLREIPVC